MSNISSPRNPVSSWFPTAQKEKTSPQMRFPTNLLGLAALTAVAVHPCLGQHGSILKVEVGADDNLRYNPASLEAPVGTKIEFHFFPKNHSVIESSFDNPCHPLSSDGFSSGFIPVTESPSNTTFTIIIKDTDPIWFYCAQANHCERGTFTCCVTKSLDISVYHPSFVH